MSAANLKSRSVQNLNEFIIEELLRRNGINFCLERAKTAAPTLDSLSNSQLSGLRDLAFQVSRVEHLVREDPNYPQDPTKNGELVKRIKRLQKAGGDSKGLETLLNDIRSLEKQAVQAAADIQKHIPTHVQGLKDDLHLRLARQYMAAAIDGQRVRRSRREEANHGSC